MEPGKVCLAELILCTKERRGDGIDTPIRNITQVFEKTGELIAEHDPCPEKRFTDEDMMNFIKWVKTNDKRNDPSNYRALLAAYLFTTKKIH